VADPSGSGWERRLPFTPALGPIFGQNPAFRTVVYDPDGVVLDRATYDLANLGAASVGGGVPPVWQAEYTVTQAWHLPRVDLPSLVRLSQMIAEVLADRGRWRTLYAVSSPGY
jgi:hypothetical protein